MLSENEKRELLGFARGAIAEALSSSPGMPVDREGHAGRLDEPGGAFVTIRIGRQLRGCIGYIESDRSLREVVAEVAPKAALEDPRFPPLSLQELQEATLEISILSPLHRIAHPEEVIVGTHGVLIEGGLHRGLLLPQVATEYRWGRDEFLDNTARKAGLPRDAWKDPAARIFIFSAEIITEEHR